MTSEKSKKKLGFGCMRLPLLSEDVTDIDFETLNGMFDRFLAEGFTYVDTAYPYHQEHSEAAVRECLVKRHPRESFLLADKMPVYKVEEAGDYERYFSEQLERCGVTYFDYYLLHNLWSEAYEKTTKLGGFEFIQKLKAEGKAKNVGFSFHDTAPVLDRILTDHPEVDFVQLQINYSDWESASIQSRECYEVAHRHKKPIIVMEPVKGGGLANPPEEVQKLLKGHSPDASCASWAIRFAASHEGVMMVLSGMSNLAQMEDNMSYMKDFRPLDEKEAGLVAQAAEIIAQSTAIPCTGCQYCVDDCPMHINIPRLFSVYNFTQQFGTNNFPAMHYNRVVAGRGKPSDCVGCGTCENRCPQHLPIRENLKLVSAMFEKE